MPDPSVPHEQTPVGLPELLMRAARMLRRRLADVLEPWELSPHQARALAALDAAGGLRVSDLARSLRIAPRSATEVVDSLAARGLAERGADPGDRRAVLVGLTDSGVAVRRDVEAARAADAEAFFGLLGAGDRDALSTALRRLTSDVAPPSDPPA